MTIDALYRGLAAPRQVIPVGREDIPAAERPGRALVDLARAALAAGPLPAADPSRPIARGAGVAAAPLAGPAHGPAADPVAEPVAELHVPDADAAPDL